MDSRARVIITVVLTVAVTSVWLLMLREVAINALYSQQAIDYVTTFALAVVGGLFVSVFPSIVWTFLEKEDGV